MSKLEACKLDLREIDDRERMRQFVYSVVTDYGPKNATEILLDVMVNREGGDDSDSDTLVTFVPPREGPTVTLNDDRV